MESRFAELGTRKDKDSKFVKLLSFVLTKSQPTHKDSARNYQRPRHRKFIKHQAATKENPAGACEFEGKFHVRLVRSKLCLIGSYL